MKATYIQPGGAIDYKNTTEQPIESGSVVVIGDRVGILTGGMTGGILPGQTGVLQVTGVFRLPTAETLEVGKNAYWDGSALTATEGGTPAGWVVQSLTGYADVKIGG